FVELLCSAQMGLVQPAGSATMEYPGPEIFSDGVVGGVTEDSRDNQYYGQNGEAEHGAFGGGQCAQSEKQGVSRQERRDHQTRFAEDDQKKHDVYPRTQHGDPLIEMGVEVENDVQELSQ